MTMQQNLLHKFIFMEDYQGKGRKVGQGEQTPQERAGSGLTWCSGGGGRGLAVLHGVLCVVALNHQRQVLADLSELVSIQQLDEVV